VSCITYESVRWDGASANTSRFQPSPFLLHNVPNLVCLLVCRNKGLTSLDDTILISIVHPECRESQHASGRAHAGRCSKLLTNCSPPARREDGEYRAGLVASTVKRQSPETSQLVPLPQSAIYSLARDLRTAAASCGRDSTITVSYPVWSSATRPAPQKTMTFDPFTLVARGSILPSLPPNY
jgi:hypothetical protein